MPKKVRVKFVPGDGEDASFHAGHDPVYFSTPDNGAGGRVDSVGLPPPAGGAAGDTRASLWQSSSSSSFVVASGPAIGAAATAAERTAALLFYCAVGIDAAVTAAVVLSLRAVPDGQLVDPVGPRLARTAGETLLQPATMEWWRPVMTAYYWPQVMGAGQLAVVPPSAASDAAAGPGAGRVMLAPGSSSASGGLDLVSFRSHALLPLLLLAFCALSACVRPTGHARAALWHASLDHGPGLEAVLHPCGRRRGGGRGRGRGKGEVEDQPLPLGTPSLSTIVLALRALALPIAVAATAVHTLATVTGAYPTLALGIPTTPLPLFTSLLRLMLDLSVAGAGRAVVLAASPSWYTAGAGGHLYC